MSVPSIGSRVPVRIRPTGLPMTCQTNKPPVDNSTSCDDSPPSCGHFLSAPPQRTTLATELARARTRYIVLPLTAD